MPNFCYDELLGFMLHAYGFTNCMTIVERALLFIDFVAGLLSIEAYVENFADPKEQQVVFIKLG